MRVSDAQVREAIQREHLQIRLRYAVARAQDLRDQVEIKVEDALDLCLFFRRQKEIPDFSAFDFFEGVAGGLFAGPVEPHDAPFGIEHHYERPMPMILRTPERR